MALTKYRGIISLQFDDKSTYVYGTHSQSVDGDTHFITDFEGEQHVVQVFDNFTGLKDFKGKEIFDNDFVTVRGCKGRVYWCKPMAAFYVSFDNQPKGVAPCNMLGFLNSVYKLEIVGNAYFDK